MASDQLVSDVVSTIIEAVNLHFIDTNTVTRETPLGEEGLGLDSVDVLEVVVALEHRFGAKVPDQETGKKVFQNIGTIADFIAENCNVAGGGKGDASRDATHP